MRVEKDLKKFLSSRKSTMTDMSKRVSNMSQSPMSTSTTESYDTMVSDNTPSSTPNRRSTLMHQASSFHGGHRREKVAIIDEHLSSQLFAVSQETRMLFSCGHWDHSFKATSLDTGRMIQSVTNHKDSVTCMALASSVGQTWLVTGSRDCTLMVWEVKQGRDLPLGPQAAHVLYGHDDAVTCVSVNADLDVVVSGSDDGTLIIHTLRTGTYIRTIYVSTMLTNASSFSDGVSDGNSTSTKRRITWACVTREGYIVIYIMEENLLCTFTINGVLLVVKEIREKLYAFTASEDGNVLLTGGEFCLVVFRWVGCIKL